MKMQELQVKNHEGLHMRVAAAIVEVSRKYKSKICFGCEDCPHAEACSIMQLMMLNANCGKKLIIKANGPDEDEAIDEMSRLFEEDSEL